MKINMSKVNKNRAKITSKTISELPSRTAMISFMVFSPFKQQMQCCNYSRFLDVVSVALFQYGSLTKDRAQDVAF